MAKRRANGEGSIRKRGEGRWEGRYTVGTDPSTGKRIVKSVFGKTQGEVREKLQRAIQENRGPAINHNGDYTVGEWMWLWFETYSKPHVRPSTISNYTNYIGNHIVPGIGHIKLRRLTSMEVQQFYNTSKESGRIQRFEGKETDKALSNRFVRGIHMVLHQALEQAKKERLINHNPCDNCRIPKLIKKEMNIIPPEKIGDYLHQAKEYGVLPIFYLELTTGLRRGELAALNWADLDISKRIITVNKTTYRLDGMLLTSDPKTENSIRKVVIPQQAVDLLVADRENHPDSQYMFPSPRTGGLWSPEAIARIHKKILKAAGIDESVRFHDLRHTFATTALLNGIDVKTVSNMLGHYSAGFTLDTYTHVTTQMQQTAAEKMGSFMEQALPLNPSVAPAPSTPPDPPVPPPLQTEEAPPTHKCKILAFPRVG